MNTWAAVEGVVRKPGGAYPHFSGGAILAGSISLALYQASGGNGEGVGGYVDLAGAIQTLGVPGVVILGFILFWVALKREWIVMGEPYRDVKAQRDRLLDLALENAKIAKEAVNKKTPTTTSSSGRGRRSGGGTGRADSG